jgi:hypothetical protein
VSKSKPDGGGDDDEEDEQEGGDDDDDDGGGDEEEEERNAPFLEEISVMAKWEPPLDLASSMPLDICCPMAGCWLVVQHYCRTLSLSLQSAGAFVRSSRRAEAQAGEEEKMSGLTRSSSHDQRSEPRFDERKPRGVLFID